MGTAQSTGERPSFQWIHVTLRTALDSLMKRYTESIVYLDKDIEGRDVSASCSNCSFDEALTTLLSGTSLTWMRRGNQIILKKQEMQQSGQYATISGTVTDSLTGEWTVGASVLLQDSADQSYKTVRRWCSTNSFGFFSLPRVPISHYTLVIRAIGYETVKKNIDSLTERYVRFNIAMIQKDIILKEVTIEGHRNPLASVEGFSRGAYRRSVPTDQNQYLLDGGRIYNPAHFGGILSTFNPEALNDVQLVLGGLPPYYGGRVGGVVDLSMRDGSRQGISGSLGLGALGSSLSLEGPLNNNTTFLVSGRLGYPDFMMQVFPSKEVKPSSMGSSELITKMTHRLSGSNQVSLVGYLGGDSYSNEVKDTFGQLNNNFSWNNRMLDLRWIGIVTPSLFLHTSAVYSRYDFNLDHVLNTSSSYFNGTPLSSNYTIEDFSLSAHAEDYYDEDHTVRAGVELIHHRMNGYISEFSNQTAPLTLNNFSSWEAAVYLQDHWKILPPVTAELGGRVTSFVGDKASFSAIDPRFSLLVSLNEQTRLYSSLSAINQFMHVYRNSGVFLIYPVIFWYPSTEKMQPSTSLHVTLGVERTLKDDAYILSAESYYRITDNLHEFVRDTTVTAPTTLEDVTLLGTGKTYGLVCSFKKRTGALTGAITYNLSWSLETFADINGGKEFSPPFDRRHELQIASSYSISEGWLFSFLCVIASGCSSSVVPKIMQPKDNRTSGHLGNPSLYNDFIDINGSRLPGFQRFELNLTRKFFLRHLPCQFSFRLMNGYGILDPFVWKLQQSNYIGLKWNATLQAQNLFPLYPSIEFTIRF